MSNSFPIMNSSMGVESSSPEVSRGTRERDERFDFCYAVAHACVLTEVLRAHRPDRPFSVTREVERCDLGLIQGGLGVGRDLAGANTESGCGKFYNGPRKSQDSGISR